MSDQVQALTYQVNRAAQMLDVSRSTIYRLAKDGHIKLVKIGKRGSRITADSVAAWLKSKQQTDAG